MDVITGKLYNTFIFENRWEIFLDGFLMTLLLTFASFLGGSVIGAIFCAFRFASSAIVRNTINGFTKMLIRLPTLVLLMVFVYILFSNASISVILVVICALTLKCGAYMSEIFYTAICNVSKGEAEAARTLGMTALQTFLHITFPQAVESMLPVYKNQFIITLQETSLVGTLAIQDLTNASSIVTSRTLDAFFGLILISVVYLIIGLICSRLLDLLCNRKHWGGSENA